jgi:hypothetical protein
MYRKQPLRECVLVRPLPSPPEVRKLMHEIALAIYLKQEHSVEQQPNSCCSAQKKLLHKCQDCSREKMLLRVSSLESRKILCENMWKFQTFRCLLWKLHLSVRATTTISYSERKCQRRTLKRPGHRNSYRRYPRAWQRNSPLSARIRFLTYACRETPLQKPQITTLERKDVPSIQKRKLDEMESDGTIYVLDNLFVSSKFRIFTAPASVSCPCARSRPIK